MRVSELIEKLKSFPQDDFVIVGGVEGEGLLKRIEEGTKGPNSHIKLIPHIYTPLEEGDIDAAVQSLNDR